MLTLRHRWRRRCDATIVNDQTNPSQLPVVFGFVSIPLQGGHDHQDLDQLSTSLVNGGTSVSDSAGSVLSSSNSSSFAKAQSVCVLPAAGACTVFASAITSQANSASGGGNSSSDAAGTSLLGLSVGGIA